MIMSSTSQLCDNVPVCRCGITFKQFGYLGELQARPSHTGSRESSAIRANVDNCSANGDVHRRSGTFVSINNYHKSIGSNICLALT